MTLIEKSFQAKDLPALDEDAANVFSKSERIGRYLCFADKNVQFVQFFHYFTSMDGLEIAATALTSTKDCPTCECPRHLLGKTNRLYPIRDTDVLRKAVEKARAELLHPDESIKHRCIEKVHVSYIISYVIS